MTSAEIRLLRFLHAQRRQGSWTAYSTIQNTEDLLPGDEKAVASLLGRGLIEKDAAQDTVRMTAGGIKALQRRMGDM